MCKYDLDLLTSSFLKLLHVFFTSVKNNILLHFLILLKVWFYWWGGGAGRINLTFVGKSLYVFFCRVYGTIFLHYRIMEQNRYIFLQIMSMSGFVTYFMATVSNIKSYY